ncbi:protein PARTING DANCERS homolog isoform X2 [Cryptomeria japonica]|uniref:protein PARTING DANCERS homolog isoform X2 n=1 Tax=Cryptomeria japonica TaxID=3369 RepID=UPI0025AC53ED|nr:protein PARTING DANCERS homolog isoform X2 [Cryptomeria japonica]
MAAAAKKVGVCIINTKWRDENPQLIHPLSSLLRAANYTLNFNKIAPDFIFNTAGVSVAFILISSWKSGHFTETFNRIEKMRSQFGNLYVIASICTEEDNQAFIRSYFKSGVALQKPAFVAVRDPCMGFEKMLKLALIHGEIKRHDVAAKIQTETFLESVEACIQVLTAIPGIDTHDAHTLMQGIGSIEAISKASKKKILESTDLSDAKAEKIVKFFNDPKYYLSPKFN